MFPRAALFAPLALAFCFAPAACGGTDAPAPQSPTAAPGSASAPKAGLSPTPGPAHWSYAGPDGPSHWGDLDPAYAVCASGHAQSPIDLPASPTQHAAAPPRPHWDAVPLVLKNNGHAIQVDDPAPSSFVLDGTSYHLAQFHFHAPAEHTIGGRSFPLEMHLVHKSDAGKLLVVAVLFSEGSDNASIAPIWAAMPGVGQPPVTLARALDPASLLPGAPRYLRYEGSLTAPPCTEGVTWLIVEPDPNLQVSPAQAKAFADHTQPTTNRPLQASQGRIVTELVP